MTTVEREWTYKGYDCRVSYTDMGFRCGYVAIPEGHPYHGTDYSNIVMSVHGGLTFCGHIEDTRWWIGFDCAHHNDAPDPQIQAVEYGARFFGFFQGTIRTLDYCILQCQYMVDQMVAQYGELRPPINIQLEDDLFVAS
jgi:hypothetical protein